MFFILIIFIRQDQQDIKDFFISFTASGLLKRSGNPAIGAPLEAEEKPYKTMPLK